MINYKIIRSMFPLAHRDLLEWINCKDNYCIMDKKYLEGEQYVPSPVTPVCYTDRDLYDFFDSVGIVISVVPNKIWSYKIVMQSPTVGWTMVYASRENVAESRTTCEGLAFNEAFGVLNDVRSNNLLNTKTKSNNEIIH